MLVQPDKKNDISIEVLLKNYLKLKYQKQGDAFCGIIHRLDRPVSGVVLCAKTSKGLVRMNEKFRAREVTKIYWALVKGFPSPDQGKLTHFLHRNERNNTTKVVEAEKKGVQKAELEYKVVGRSEYYSLLEVIPHTGRHHQIRVQLAHIKMPIKGDLKYGSPRSNPDGSISLHARKLIFVHPVTNEPVEIMAPPPKDPLWDSFLK